MQALTDAVESKYPGVTIYGKGDAAHQLEVSGHNEDDTPGVRAELQDADSVPEHRAIDIMVRGPFTKAAGDALVAALLADPAARARLYYIIWYGYIWSRTHGWEKRAYSGSDQHKDHVHISGWAADDENTAGWPAVYKGGVNLLFCKQDDNNEAVGALQVRLKNLGYYDGEVDNDYGAGTTAALKKACQAVNPTTTADGTSYSRWTMFYVDVLMNRKYGKDAPDLTPLLNRLAAAEKKIAELAAAPTGGVKLPIEVTFTGTLAAK